MKTSRHDFSTSAVANIVLRNEPQMGNLAWGVAEVTYRDAAQVNSLTMQDFYDDHFSPRLIKKDGLTSTYGWYVPVGERITEQLLTLLVKRGHLDSREIPAAQQSLRL